MSQDWSIEFFDRQFARQVGEPDIGLNPFEQSALPQLRGHVLEYGCGMGQLALAAARAGCSVVALDASAVAIQRLQRVAAQSICKSPHTSPICVTTGSARTSTRSSASVC